MTQEEKAKAYDEALDRAKRLESPFYADAAKIIFPEIKDSPEEKTRKFIIECIEELRKANASNADFNGQCSEAIAWLEKHKPAEKKKADNGFFGWPNVTNCKRDCKTCFAKCLYRKEENLDMTGGEKHTIGYMQKDKSFTENEKWDGNRIGVELWGFMESLGLPSDNLPDVYYKIAEHFFNLSKCLTMDDVVKWIDKWANSYVNGEYNEFHKDFEYDGTVNKNRLIKDLQKYISER